ncbi:protein IQ-DOMAIN 33-like [Phragmites australis]|uniref:protein IQ-DOMAIN 33-like n=1 Tax=Phragmites australis TaxID=29695 RepID=UPI002D792E86|nr:protein IQ-DOMAIN 33-like [Phragmites australis]
MGLAGGIVRRVFSKNPCSSAGGRGHSEKGSADHRRRWSSLRLYLCGEEMNAGQEEEDDETVSVRSFETFVMQQQPHIPVAQPSEVHNANYPGEPEDQGIPSEPSHAWAGKEEAATLIQSALRGFMARRQLQESRKRKERDGADEPRSPTSASVAASLEVEVAESLSNLRLSEDSASVQQRASQKSRPPPVFRVKEDWDDSTVSSNVSRMRIQSRIEATTRRERALAYAFSQQLRSCGGTKKRSARPDQAEFNMGWSWLERWMATRQAEPADDCMSRNADTGSATAGRRVVVVRRRNDLAVEEKESCGSNDASVVSFDGSSFGSHKPGRSRLKGARNLPRRKVASSDHRLQARSHKVRKKGHRREEQALQKDQAETEGAYDACQPPTDY